MRRLAVLSGLGLLLCACGLLEPAPVPIPVPAPAEEVPAAPVIQPPPAVLINGVAGKPVSWCWATACFDGFVNSPLILPAVEPPYEIELPEGARIEGVFAVGPFAAGGEEMRVEREGMELGEVPDGAVMLNIGIRFDQGGDASYYWAINQADD